jgi:hypothetical protein
LINVSVLGPLGTAVEESLLDTGADDTVFPEDVATQIGIDLTNAPTGGARGVGGGVGILRFVEVTFRLASTTEQRVWRAWVGFTSTRMWRPLLGYAGFLQYFDVTFRGAKEEVELVVNALYPGI